MYRLRHQPNDLRIKSKYYQQHAVGHYPAKTHSFVGLEYRVEPQALTQQKYSIYCWKSPQCEQQMAVPHTIIPADRSVSMAMPNASLLSAFSLMSPNANATIMMQ